MRGLGLFEDLELALRQRLPDAAVVVADVDALLAVVVADAGDHAFRHPGVHRPLDVQDPRPFFLFSYPDLRLLLRLLLYFFQLLILLILDPERTNVVGETPPAPAAPRGA